MMIVQKIFRKIKFLIETTAYSLEQQARRAGVTMGSGNEIMSRFWSSEPYLIEIGDNCQITNGVKFFTHGGGKWQGPLSQGSIASAK